MSIGAFGYFFIVVGLLLGTESTVLDQTGDSLNNQYAPNNAVEIVMDEDLPVDFEEVVETSDNEHSSATDLAQCLTTRGAKFYGAYWCSHCNDQKSRFGEALQYVTYIECDAEGPKGNPEACIAAGIEGYPTWQMPGKTEQVGAQSLETLAKWSGCSYTSN